MKHRFRVTRVGDREAPGPSAGRMNNVRSRGRRQAKGAFNPRPETGVQLQVTRCGQSHLKSDFIFVHRDPPDSSAADRSSDAWRPPGLLFERAGNPPPTVHRDERRG